MFRYILINLSLHLIIANALMWLLLKSNPKIQKDKEGKHHSDTITFKHVQLIFQQLTSLSLHYVLIISRHLNCMIIFICISRESKLGKNIDCVNVYFDYDIYFNK